jgi:hypothetical protein
MCNFISSALVGTSKVLACSDLLCMVSNYHSLLGHKINLKLQRAKILHDEKNAKDSTPLRSKPCLKAHVLLMFQYFHSSLEISHHVENAARSHLWFILAEWLERLGLTLNAEVATVLGSIPNSQHLRHRRIWGAADEAALNKVTTKNPP